MEDNVGRKSSDGNRGSAGTGGASVCVEASCILVRGSKNSGSPDVVVILVVVVVVVLVAAQAAGSDSSGSSHGKEAFGSKCGARDDHIPENRHGHYCGHDCGNDYAYHDHGDDDDDDEEEEAETVEELMGTVLKAVLTVL